MASIEQIIKDLEDLAAKGGVSGGAGANTDRKKAAAFAKEALKNSKECFFGWIGYVSGSLSPRISIEETTISRL